MTKQLWRNQMKSDIDFILGDIHGRSCKKKSCNIGPHYNGIQLYIGNCSWLFHVTQSDLTLKNTPVAPVAAAQRESMWAIPSSAWVQAIAPYAVQVAPALLNATFCQPVTKTAK